MPHPFPRTGSQRRDGDCLPDPADDVLPLGPLSHRKNSLLGRFHPPFHRVGTWLKKDEDEPDTVEPGQKNDKPRIQVEASPSNDAPTGRRSFLGRRLSSKKDVVPGLPRPQTFRRQNSEKRERLLAVEPSILERRAVSEDRRRGVSTKRLQSPPPLHPPSLPAPQVGSPDRFQGASELQVQAQPLDASDGGEETTWSGFPSGKSALENGEPFMDTEESEGLSERELQDELDLKWILNLSMHFRDKSDREKFFITYAQEPNRWRRVTVSCDYRSAPPDSLEADLKSLHYQRDKSLRIFEAIRDSLPDIQFYPTVTNLKLETDDGRLHVHVTEDINEAVPYPSTALVKHIDCDLYSESELQFESHISGFVYKVRLHDRILIKKEIPGPDTVDEFLYEVNALEALRGSASVVAFHGLVTDEPGDLVKGLLLSFACGGALSDILYDYKGTDHLPWSRREKWARQVIQGLSEIHEAGYVQGDFTLSNIVIDEHDDAKIIDINRRGCPVGWEPPELARLIESGQRITMFIGVKSDIFQLGMVLWALAEESDEPEREERPLMGRLRAPVPRHYEDLLDSCLDDNPRRRMGARDLLEYFDIHAQRAYHVDMARTTLAASDRSSSTHRAQKVYIDPAAAVGLEDIGRFRQQRPWTATSQMTSGQFSYLDHTLSTDYGGSARVLGSGRSERGRSSLSHRQRRPSPCHRPASSATSVSPGGSRDAEREPEDDAGDELGDAATETDQKPNDSKNRCSTPVDPEQHPQDLSESHQGLVPRPPLSAYGMAHRFEERDAYDEIPLSRAARMTHPHHPDNGVLFRPPTHQDSGFDEFLYESPCSLHFGDRAGIYTRNAADLPFAAAHPPQHLRSALHDELNPPEDDLCGGVVEGSTTPVTYYTPLATPPHR